MGYTDPAYQNSRLVQSVIHPNAVKKLSLPAFMLKRCVIFLFLVTAYSVLLAHNFTPHHHAEEVIHHHDDHGHSHSHHEEGEGHKDAGDAFQHFDHIGGVEVQYLPIPSQRYTSQKKVDQQVLLKALVALITHFEKPPLIAHRPCEEGPFLSGPVAYLFPLKAPPAFPIA
jgi:hypothetical protein